MFLNVSCQLVTLSSEVQLLAAAADSRSISSSSCTDNSPSDSSTSSSFVDSLELYNDTFDPAITAASWSEYDNPLATWMIVVWAIVAAGTSFVTVSGNLIVLLSFFLERSIRQPTNYFIASLAMSDLLIGAVSMPFYTVYLLNGQQWSLGEFLCDLWLSVDYTACLCSIYTVLCITIDRFCSVKLPAKYREWRSESRILCIVAFTWIVPALVFFPSIFGWQFWVGTRTVPVGKCYVQYMDEPLFNCFLQIGYFWVTLIVMCCLYTAIYQVALNLQRKSERKQNLTSSFVTLAGQRFAQIGIGMTDSTRGSAMKREAIRLTELSDKEPCLPRLALRKSHSCSRDSGGSSPDYPSDTEMTPATPMVFSHVTRFLGHPLSSAAQAALPATKKFPSQTPIKKIKPNFRMNSVIQHNHNDGKKKTSAIANKEIQSTCCEVNTDAIDKNYVLEHVKPYVQCHIQHVNDSEQSSVDTDLSDMELLFKSRKTNNSTANKVLLDKVRIITNSGDHNGSANSQTTRRDVYPSLNISQERYDDGEVWKKRTSFSESSSILSFTKTNKQYESILAKKSIRQCTSENTESVAVPRARIAAIRLRLRMITKYKSTTERRNTTKNVRKTMSSDSEPGLITCQSGSHTQLVQSSNPSTTRSIEPTKREATKRTLSGKRLSAELTDCDENTGSKSKTSFFYKSLLTKRGLGRSEDARRATTTSVNQKTRRANRARKALRTITIILGTFVCCWTPWHVLSMIIGFCSAEDRVCVTPALYDISYYLCYLNSPLNPFCYALANKQFKNAFTRILRLDWHIS